MSHVAEENEGWYRLRTVANHWSSDEDRGCDAVVGLHECVWNIQSPVLCVDDRDKGTEG